MSQDQLSRQGSNAGSHNFQPQADGAAADGDGVRGAANQAPLLNQNQLPPGQNGPPPANNLNVDDGGFVPAPGGGFVPAGGGGVVPADGGGVVPAGGAMDDGGAQARAAALVDGGHNVPGGVAVAVLAVQQLPAQDGGGPAAIPPGQNLALHQPDGRPLHNPPNTQPFRVPPNPFRPGLEQYGPLNPFLPPNQRQLPASAPIVNRPAPLLRQLDDFQPPAVPPRADVLQRRLPPNLLEQQANIDECLRQLDEQRDEQCRVLDDQNQRLLRQLDELQQMPNTSPCAQPLIQRPLGHAPPPVARRFDFPTGADTFFCPNAPPSHAQTEHFPPYRLPAGDDRYQRPAAANPFQPQADVRYPISEAPAGNLQRQRSFFPPQQQFLTQAEVHANTCATHPYLAQQWHEGERVAAPPDPIVDQLRRQITALTAQLQQRDDYHRSEVPTTDLMTFSESPSMSKVAENVSDVVQSSPARDTAAIAASGPAPLPSVTLAGTPSASTGVSADAATTKSTKDKPMSPQPSMETRVLTLPVDIAGRTISAQVDTGSPITIMGIEPFQRLLERDGLSAIFAKLRPSKCQFADYSGNAISLHRLIAVDLGIQGCTLRSDVYFDPQSQCDLIIGMDVLSQIGCSLAFTFPQKVNCIAPAANSDVLPSVDDNNSMILPILSLSCTAESVCSVVSERTISGPCKLLSEPTTGAARCRRDRRQRAKRRLKSDAAIQLSSSYESADLKRSMCVKEPRCVCRPVNARPRMAPPPNLADSNCRSRRCDAGHRLSNGSGRRLPCSSDPSGCQRRSSPISADDSRFSRAHMLPQKPPSVVSTADLKGEVKPAIPALLSLVVDRPHTEHQLFDVPTPLPSFRSPNEQVMKYRRRPSRPPPTPLPLHSQVMNYRRRPSRPPLTPLPPHSPVMSIRPVSYRTDHGLMTSANLSGLQLPFDDDDARVLQAERRQEIPPLVDGSAVSTAACHPMFYY